MLFLKSFRFYADHLSPDHSASQVSSGLPGGIGAAGEPESRKREGREKKEKITIHAESPVNYPFSVVYCVEYLFQESRISVYTVTVPLSRRKASGMPRSWPKEDVFR